MAIAHAYGDDSGTHKDAEYCLMLGYVASPAQWRLFRRDWKRALGDVKEFHAKDFFNRASWKSDKSPYRGWGDEQATAFLDGLLEAIHRHHLYPIGGAVKVEDFFKYPEGDRRWLTGAALLTMGHWHNDQLEITEKLLEHESSPERPYFIVLPGFFVEAINAAPNAQIHLWFDEQGSVEVRAKEYYLDYKKHAPKGDHLESISFRSSAKELPLQAADMYAFVWGTRLHNKRPNNNLERAFAGLTRKKGVPRIIDKSYFDEMLVHREKTRREGMIKAWKARPS